MSMAAAPLLGCGDRFVPGARASGRSDNAGATSPRFYSACSSRRISRNRPGGAAADSGSGKARPGSTPAAPLPGEVWAKLVEVIGNMQNTLEMRASFFASNNIFRAKFILAFGAQQRRHLRLSGSLSDGQATKAMVYGLGRDHLCPICLHAGPHGLRPRLPGAAPGSGGLWRQAAGVTSDAIRSPCRAARNGKPDRRGFLAPETLVKGTLVDERHASPHQRALKRIAQFADVARPAQGRELFNRRVG